MNLQTVKTWWTNASPAAKQAAKNVAIFVAGVIVGFIL